MARFTAHVATYKNGSECQTEFEVPDDQLVGLSADELEEMLAKEAQDAIYDAGYLSIWFTPEEG